MICKDHSTPGAFSDHKPLYDLPPLATWQGVAARLIGKSKGMEG